MNASVKKGAPCHLPAETSKTRAVLLDNTERLMLEEGYAAVSYRTVAAISGVTPWAVQYYFPTLDDLFLGALRGRTERNLEELAESLKAHPDDAPSPSGRGRAQPHPRCGSGPNRKRGVAKDHQRHHSPASWLSRPRFRCDPPVWEPGSDRLRWRWPTSREVALCADSLRGHRQFETGSPGLLRVSPGDVAEH